MRNVFLKAIMSLALVSLLALGSCAKQRGTEDALEKRIKALEVTTAALDTKAKDLGTKLQDVSTDLAAAKESLTKEVNALQAQLKELKEKGATKEEIAALEKKLTEKLVSLEAFNKFKNTIEAEIKDVKSKLDGKVDKATLAVLEGRVKAIEDWRATTTTDIKALQEKVTTLEGEVKKLNEALTTTNASLKEVQDAVATLTTKVTDLNEALTTLKLAVEGRLKVLETELNLKDGKLVRIDGIEASIKEMQETLKDHIAKIEANEGSITKLQEDLKALANRVTLAEANIVEHTTLIAANALAIQANKEAIEANKTAIAKNGTDIAANTAAIEANKESIAANQALIEANKADIEKNALAIAAAQLVIENNVAAITKNAEDIAANKAAIEAAEDAIQVNADAIAANKGLIDKNIEDITKLFSEITRVDGRITKLEGELKLKITEVYAAIAKLASEVRGLTFIPTRGLYEEKTAKLYYYADDYTALHTLIFQVSPSTAKLGVDFEVEGLQYQMTTRADEHDAANIDIVIDGEVTQEGDRIYVPVRIKNTNADTNVYGMYDAWWNNKYFYNAMASMQLEKANFPQYVVDNSNRTFKKTEYNIKYPTEQIGQKNKVRDELTLDGKHNTFTAPKYDTPKRIDALSINLVVKNTRDGAENTIKASEYVHANLIPVQIKLAWNNPNKSGSLESQLLPFTQVDAVKMANKVDGQNPLGTNWHATLFRGQISANGQNFDVAPLNLDELVQSYYYPADGADFSNEENVATDPFRSFYNQIGTFGKPETDKPAFAEPEYKYEIVAYKDTENEVIGGTHIYAKIVEGNKLVPIKESHRNANDKKLIVRVTQTNSELAARQPIGYLVIKMTEQTENKTWNPVEYTIDSAADKKYLITCANGGAVNTTHVKDGTTYDKASALYFLQLPEFNTIGGNSDFKNAPYVLGGADYVTAPVDEYDARNAKLVERDLKFEVAANNLITDVTPEEAWKHIAIRFNRDLNKYVVTVKDNLAPAGTYTGTFKLRHLNGVKQAGPDLILTFKFTIAINDVVAVRDDVNWKKWNDTEALHVEYANLNNTFNRIFLRNGYVGDLTQAFKLAAGSKKVAISASPENEVEFAENCDFASIYNLRFEFVTKDEAELKAYDRNFGYNVNDDKFNVALKYNESGLDNTAVAIDKDADEMERIKFTPDKYSDFVYNYLIGDRAPGKEKALYVRLVADVVYNQYDADKNPEGRSLNRVLIDEFPVVFERALFFDFTPYDLADRQDIQTQEFVFSNKFNTLNGNRGVYAIDPEAEQLDEDKYLVIPTNDYGKWFGLVDKVEMPLFYYTTDVKQPDGSIKKVTRALVDYEYIEISEDGGKTWEKMNNTSIFHDYQIHSTHSNRYFAIELDPMTGKYTAMWQGDATAIEKGLKFRASVLNRTAIRNKVVNGNTGTTEINPKQKTTITFRHGFAKVYPGSCYVEFNVKKTR